MLPPTSLHAGRPVRLGLRRRWSGWLVFGAALLGWAAPARAADANILRLGAVDFVATGSAAAQPHFQRGVAALHSFWYEEAQSAFQRALEIDPEFAMAWWGLAMACHRPYLAGSDDTAGRAALGRIRDLTHLTPREGEFIAALRTYYSDRPWGERTLAYASAMEKLYRHYPDDPEAAAFYAVSLLGYGWAADEGPARQEQAAAVAAEVYRRNPRHPGAAHYIIHSFDDPTLAGRGLDAARHYAAIAPDAPHALHMPSHIFLRLGLWPETVRSNEVAWEASQQWVTARQLGLNQRDYHNYHWLIYACLQQGRYVKAADLVRAFKKMQPDISLESRHFLNDALASYVIETRQWQQADALFTLSPATSANTTGGARSTLAPEICGARPEDGAEAGASSMPAYIKAFAAAAAGSPEASALLATLRKSAMANNVLARFWRIRILEVTAVGRAHGGDVDGALAAIRQATQLEESFIAPPGPPSSTKPPHELAGEILLQAGRPAEAALQFDIALQRHPGRARALLGRARAAAALPDRAAALAGYARFLELWHEADADRPELAEARAFADAPARPR